MRPVVTRKDGATKYTYPIEMTVRHIIMSNKTFTKCAHCNEPFPTELRYMKKDQQVRVQPRCQEHRHYTDSC